MNVFPKNTTFKYDWRTYQKKILDNMDDYLHDNHLHISAPPGSGKTILGLEIMLRLGEPTLIVAPTLAIKTNGFRDFVSFFWIQKLFLNGYLLILKTGILTVTTYQGIHSASGVDEQDEDLIKKKLQKISVAEIVKRLEKLKVGTLILDEAHHLKNARWRSLMELKNKISPTVVALTATPPFDVSGSEWQKYIQLNGPIDVEISVPELMIEGDLCPHQDLVYFTSPSKEEEKKLNTIIIKAATFFQEVQNDDTLFEALEQHPVYLNPALHLEWIYENISSYTSGLVYLHFRGKEISDIHFNIIGDEQNYVPEFDFFWMEELLDFYLLLDDINFKKKYIDHRTDLGNRLRRLGFLEQRTISFYNSKKCKSDS